LVVLGLMAMGSAFIATLTVAFTFGILLLISSGAELASAIWARRWSGFFIHILSGILYLVVSLLMVEHPIGAAAGLTLMLAAAFLAQGLVRIVMSLSQRFHSWVWVFLNGVVSLLLGIFIWRRWPEDSLWVLGLFIGIELVFTGMTWVMLGLSVRGIPSERS